MTEVRPRRLAGRCSDGAERGAGALYHAVPAAESVALCGARPGRLSAGWSAYVGEEVTCRRCMARFRDRAIGAAR